MGYLDFYQYQAKARGINELEDVIRCGREASYIYDRIVLPWLPTTKSSRIAELACGHGSVLWWLKEHDFARIEGVDSSAEQIRFARQIGATVAEADVNMWLASQSDSSIQTLIAIDLIEHLSKDDFVALLKNSSRVLTRGGRLILRYPNGDSPLVGLNLFNDITHVWTYTSNCLNTLAGMYAFARVEYRDQSNAIRDFRFLKVPLSKLTTLMLRLLFQAATREKVLYWGPHLWAALEK